MIPGAKGGRLIFIRQDKPDPDLDTFIAVLKIAALYALGAGQVCEIRYGIPWLNGCVEEQDVAWYWDKTIKDLPLVRLDPPKYIPELGIYLAERYRTGE